MNPLAALKEKMIVKPKVEENEKVAIVGRTGAGKVIYLNLLLVLNLTGFVQNG